MDIAHVKLQYARLERHHLSALKNKDPISFLDLSHTLRIWVELKSFVDELAKEKSIILELNNPNLSKTFKQFLKKNIHTHLPLANGVTSTIKIQNVVTFDRALTDEELIELTKPDTPQASFAQKSNLCFSDWLSSGVYEVPSGDVKHPHLKLSREIIIKRVANILGASHPIGTENADMQENKFDPYILDLHKIQLADGYPATYYQLLEIANDILENTKCLFNNQD